MHLYIYIIIIIKWTLSHEGNMHAFCIASNIYNAFLAIFRFICVIDENSMNPLTNTDIFMIAYIKIGL